MSTFYSNSLSQDVRAAYQLSEKFNKEAFRIEAGSDTHLDIITHNTAIFSQLDSVLSKLNDLIEQNFPSNKEVAEELKLILHSLHSSLSLFIDKIKNTKFAKISYQDAIDSLETENAQILEYIEDINNYILLDEELITDNFFEE